MRLFITGLSGLLGVNLALMAREAHDVEGSVHAHDVRIDGVAAHRLDLTDAQATAARVRASRPDVVIHTAGLTNVDECERRPQDAMRHNADATQNVAAATAAAGAHLIHISTDHLFDGRKAFVSEDEPPAPMNAYARSKLAAERNVQRSAPNATIVRTNFYGWGTPIRASFSDWILAALRDGRPLGLFSDVHYTPIQLNDLADVLLAFAERRPRGVLNVVGGERLTKYEFGLRLAEGFGFHHHKLAPTTLQQVGLPAARPADLSLSVSKVEAVLTRRMPDIASGLRRLRSLEKEGWPRQVSGAVATRTPKVR